MISIFILPGIKGFGKYICRHPDKKEMLCLPEVLIAVYECGLTYATRT